MNAVFSWRCKCGVRVKAVGETDPDNPLAQCTVQCPDCREEQTLSASKIVSVTNERDEASRVQY